MDIKLNTEDGYKHVIALAEQRVQRLEALLKRCYYEGSLPFGLAEGIQKELLGRPCMEDKP